MLSTKRFVRYAAIGTLGVGFLASLRANEYKLGATGAVRLSRAALTVFTIGSHYKGKLYNSGLTVDSDEYLTLKSEVHAFAAQKLLELCKQNKGVYIKVGQHIGALDYLLPKEYVQTMKVLHSSAPQSSFSDVLKVLREDLKRDPYEIFESIDENPLGAASLAQVHRAVLKKDGTVVAVKVQHRAVKTNSYVDIKTMSALVRVTSWIFPEFKFDWLVDETKKNIPQELDFLREGRNAEKVEKLYSHYEWFKVPGIHWDLSTNRVLTMEYIEGGQVDNLKYIHDNELNPFEISNKLGQLYSHMIFVTGFVHSDPHPGNVIVRPMKNNKQAEIILLDHGLYAELTDKFRYEYSKLWLAIFDGDKNAMYRHCQNLGIGDMYGLLACMVSGRTWDAIMSGVQRTKVSGGEKNQFLKEIPGLLPKISEVLERVDRQMLLILKTNDLIRSIEHSLQTKSRMGGYMEMSKCCIKFVYNDRMKSADDGWTRLWLRVAEQWSFLKISLYYVYLGVLNLDIHKTVDSVWNRASIYQY